MIGFYFHLTNTTMKHYLILWSYHDNLHKHFNIYGKNSIVVNASNVWNNSQKLLKFLPRHLSPNKIKKTFS